MKFQVGDLVTYKETFGVGLIVGKLNHSYSYAILWLEHDFISRYINERELKKVA